MTLSLFYLKRKSNLDTFLKKGNEISQFTTMKNNWNNACIYLIVLKIQLCKFLSWHYIINPPILANFLIIKCTHSWFIKWLSKPFEHLFTHIIKISPHLMNEKLGGVLPSYFFSFLDHSGSKFFLSNLKNHLILTNN